MTKFVRLTLSFFASAWAAPSLAGENTYFHKPEVTREAFLLDHLECDDLASGVQRPRSNVYTSDVYAAAAASLLSGLINSRERQANVENVLRTCMADKGYRRVRAPKNLRSELKGITHEERIERLFVLATSADPRGEVLPL